MIKNLDERIASILDEGADAQEALSVAVQIISHVFDHEGSDSVKVQLNDTEWALTRTQVEVEPEFEHEPESLTMH